MKSFIGLLLILILIKSFYWAFTGVSSAQTRSLIFSKLVPKFNHMIDLSLASNLKGWSNDDLKDVRQDVLIHIWKY